MSAKCQNQTSSQNLINHLICAYEQRRWQINPDGLCGSGIDHSFEFRRLLDRHVGRLGAFQQLGGDVAGLTPQLD